MGFLVQTQAVVTFQSDNVMLVVIILVIISQVRMFIYSRLTFDFSTSLFFQVQQGRTGNSEKEITVAAHAAKADFSSPSNLFKAGLNPAR